MAEPDRIERAENFQRDLLAWTALHHFLSASLLRELATATIECYSPGQTLKTLFEDHLTDNGVAGTWSIAPREIDSEALQFLQIHIRTLVWANDGENYPHSASDDQELQFGRNLSDALRLGRLDFATEVYELDRFQFPDNSGAFFLVEALRAAITTGGNDGIAVEAVAEPLRGLPQPLQTLALKHFGDLCADVDAWDEAAWFYDRAGSGCSTLQSVWRDLALYMTDVVAQSHALTIWITRGATTAAPHFKTLVQNAAPTRLAKLNGSHEELVVRMESDNLTDGHDIRASTLLSPLLLGAQDVGPAVRAWQTGEFATSHRYFWSTLRRQIALGSYSESRNTKALFGRALLAETSEVHHNRASFGGFEFGARLLVEAGRAKGLDTLSFSTWAVERYVTSDLIDRLTEVADRHGGVRHLRSLAFIELLAKWAEVLPKGENKRSQAVLGQLIGRTQAFEASFHGNRNVGGQGLKLLRRLAEERPDLRRPFGDAIAKLIVQKLVTPGFWTGQSGALELAVAYVDAFEPEALRDVLAASLAVLQRASPDEGHWPISRPALQLLASKKALEVASQDAELSPGYVSSLLRYGVAQRSAGVGLLFAISRFPGDVPLSSEDKSALQDVVNEVRAGARELNNGSVTDFIRAVIVGVQHTGKHSVAEAVDSLVLILKSAGGKRGSIALPYAYGPVLDLLDSQAEVLGAGVTADELREWLDAIEAGLEIAWTAILQRPELLASFSIPREQEPDATLVYNWSFMTRKFIAQCSRQATLGALLDAAAALPELSRGMFRAALSTAKPDQLENLELEGIAREDAEAFYAAIGRRIKIASEAPDELQIALLDAMLRRCLVLGPHELDLPVFMAASPLRTKLTAEIAGTDYLHQLSSNWALRMNLEPYLRSWLDTG